MQTYLYGAGILAIPRETESEDPNPTVEIVIGIGSSEKECRKNLIKQRRQLFPGEIWRTKTESEKFTREDIQAIYKDSQEKLFFIVFLLMPFGTNTPLDFRCFILWEKSREKAEESGRNMLLYEPRFFKRAKNIDLKEIPEGTVRMHIKEVPEDIIHTILSPHLH